MNLGQTIYSLRTQHHLSQGDLANALDVSRQSVSKWENDSAVPELDKLVKMAALFGVTLDELVGNPLPQPPAPEILVPQQPSVRNLVGIVLLGCSLLSAIAFLIFLAPIWILLVSAPVCLISILCLLPQKHFWRNTFLILGIVITLTIVFCMIFFGQPSPSSIPIIG